MCVCVCVCVCVRVSVRMCVCLRVMSDLAMVQIKVLRTNACSCDSA